jgi:hypothetical protein
MTIVQTHSEAAKLKQKLNELIAIACQVETKLADKLKAIASPLEKMPSGKMMERKYLLLGLKEILADTEVWLCYCLATPEAQQQIKDLFLQIEKYWYLEIFPSWFKKHDKDFPRWRESLIKGSLPADDTYVISDIGRTIARHQRQNKDYKYQRAKIISKLIADKAMDTDLIASATQENPLCLQLTQTAPIHIKDYKLPEWEKTYNYYEIKRGLFASYNPKNPDYINCLMNQILLDADNIEEGKYKVVFL